MKIRIQVQFEKEPGNATIQKAPIDRRKVLLFIFMIAVSLALLSSLYLIDQSPASGVNQTALVSQKVTKNHPVETNEQIGRILLEPPGSDRENIAGLDMLFPVNETEVTPAIPTANSAKHAVATLDTQPPVDDAGIPAASSAKVVEPTLVVEEPTDLGATQSMSLSKKIPRLVLTSGIENREPIDDLGAEISHKLKKLYLFNETQNMVGQHITHRWLLNDRVMAKVKLSIDGERWRTYSSKIVSPRMTGHWRIEVIDSAGQLLNAHNFDYYH